MGAEAIAQLIFERQLLATTSDIAEGVAGVQSDETIAGPEPNPEETIQNVPEEDVKVVPQSFNCWSCGCDVVAVADPRDHGGEPSSSTQLPYAVSLNCLSHHIFCIPCIRLFIGSKLGDAKAGKKAFPVRCPQCWVYGLDLEDSLIEKVVSEEMFAEWQHWKLIEGIPTMYCPNPRCSELLQVPDADCQVLESDCPSCGLVLCVSCRVPWHKDMTCKQWLKSPENLNVEELYVRRLAQKNRWRRCPACKVVVERVEGCNHMSCRCGFHYCNQCGSEWINGCSTACQRWQADETLYAPGRIKLFMQQAARFIHQASPRVKRSLSNANLKLNRTRSASYPNREPLSPTSDLTEEEPTPEQGKRPTWGRWASSLSFSQRKRQI